MNEKILGMVRNLLAKADASTFPGEAETYREKAESLMRKYRIEEEKLIAEDPRAMSPEWAEIHITDMASPFQGHYQVLFSAIARHVGIRYVSFWASGTDPNQGRSLQAQSCGYASDLKLADIIYTSARIAFSNRLEPKPDPSLSEDENIYRMRSAGMERGRIATLLWGKESANGNAKVGRVYKEVCAARGERAALNGRGVSAKLYREVYAREFVFAIQARLMRARDAADSAGGGAVQLAGREERVNEAFYGRYPQYRPSNSIETPQPCERCKKTKHESKRCQSHRPAKWTSADEARWQRENNSSLAEAAREVGRAAARDVMLDGQDPNRIDSYTPEEREASRAIRGMLNGG